MIHTLAHLSARRQMRPVPVTRPPVYPNADLDAIVPADPRQTYDMREVIARIVDGSELREFKQEYGKTILTVGIVRSQMLISDRVVGLCRDPRLYVGHLILESTKD